MTTNDTPDAGQELAAGQALEATGNEQQGRQEQTAEERRTYDAEYVEKLRKENAEHRKARREAESELTKRREAEMTDQQRLEAERQRLADETTRLQQQLKAERIRAEVATVAAELRIPNAGKLASLLNPALIEFSDDGQPTNVKKLLQDLVRSIAPQSTSAGNPGRDSGERQQRQRPQSGAASFFDPQTARQRGGGVMFDPTTNPRQRED